MNKNPIVLIMKEKKHSIRLIEKSYSLQYAVPFKGTDEAI